jgi:hypothetical protein
MEFTWARTEDQIPADHPSIQTIAKQCTPAGITIRQQAISSAKRQEEAPQAILQIYPR